MASSTDIVAEMMTVLRRIANVPVHANVKPVSDENSIMISTMKMNELVGMYKQLYQFTSTVWKNLPPTIDYEPVFMIVWMLASENYDINHFTITWPGSTQSTFVHLWSIVNRIRTVLDTETANWFIASRDPVGYCTALEVTGPADAHLYLKERTIPHHIEVFAKDANRITTKDVPDDYDSYTQLRLNMMMKKKKKMINVDEMAMRNAEIISSRKGT